ncbi:hypothetical protein [Plantactinospora alkalitolerans]|uniref:hypothetical protein n=1 Tax=Plantactinospora alkalitolerans TaxID=2789879 RepID=UPI001E460F75|nr:hypothetical protein [Plantactinospora alkalitolerans]
MPLLDLHKLTAGLPRGWAGFLRDWDRSLRAGNYPQTTLYRAKTRRTCCELGVLGLG